MQFGDKIRFTVGILRFVDIRSNTGSGSADLIGNDRFVLTFQEFHQIEYLHGKGNISSCRTPFLGLEKHLWFDDIIHHKSKICKCNRLDKIIILVDKFIIRQ